VSPIDLRCGDWRDVLADVECDALICDPPYGERTHAGHSSVKVGGVAVNQDIPYMSWSPDDVRSFVAHWAPRTRGWFVAMTSHCLWSSWEAALQESGRYVFHPLPAVVRGMSVRLVGDGPASWAVWMVVARPRSREMASWGSLPGAYVTSNAGRCFVGGKTMQLMTAVVSDYSRPGDLVCDPTAGYGTTLRAAVSLGRRAVGAEIDPTTHAAAMERLHGGFQGDLFAGGVA